MPPRKQTQALDRKGKIIMRRAMTKHQRQQQRYAMNWESFMDRVVVVACLLIIVWSLIP